MQDKDFQKNKFNREKTQESAMSIAYDNKCRKEDVDKYINKHMYLQQYRNQNKTVCIYRKKREVVFTAGFFIHSKTKQLKINYILHTEQIYSLQILYL